MLMLDQRGTGRSTPIGHCRRLTPTSRPTDLAYFRADSIVRDAELIRARLGVDRWSVLGQSFGGFCVTAYLSIAPGGAARGADHRRPAAVRRAGRGGLRRHLRPHRSPRNRALLRALPRRPRRACGRCRLLDADDVRLPDGDRLTGRRLRQLGHVLGFSDGAERLHALLELPQDSLAFLHDVADRVRFARNPLYACSTRRAGPTAAATRWAAERVRPPRTTTPSCSPASTSSRGCFDDYGGARAAARGRRTAGRAGLAAALRRRPARRERGPGRGGDLRDDLYVERASRSRPPRSARPAAWLTNEYEHNGLRADGERILGRLLDLARGRA